MYFCFEHLTLLIENNNKMTETDVGKVWMEKQVIMCWFVTFESFRVK